MAAVPVLRAVRRLRGEVTLLPQIVITPRRTESGGKGAERTGVSKTLVSFPAKQPHVWPSVTGENAAGPSTILHQLDVGRESSVDPGQETERSEPRQEEDSSSSSDSSSSDSDSDQEETEERKETAEAQKQKDPSDQKRGSKHQETGRPETREQEVLGEKKAGEDLAAVATPKQIQHITHSGEKTHSGGQYLTGEDLVDVALNVDTQVQSRHDQSQSWEKTPSGGEDLVDVAPTVDTQVESPRDQSKFGEKTFGGQDLTGEDLVDVAPAVDTQVQSPHDQFQFGEKTRSGGQDLTGEDLVDVAPAVDTQVQSPHDQFQFGAKTRSGGQDLTGEDLIDGTLTMTIMKAAQDEAQAPDWAEEARIASSQDQDVQETPASDESKDLSGEPSASSPDPLAACDEPPSADSLTPPPPSVAPTPEEPFDNSKYQNQQHFSYTPLTFVDYDVALAEYRLPQPSSGRPSPQH